MAQFGGFPGAACPRSDFDIGFEHACIAKNYEFIPQVEHKTQVLSEELIDRQRHAHARSRGPAAASLRFRFLVHV